MTPPLQSRLDTGAIVRSLLDPQDPRLRELYRRRTGRSILALARCWMLIAAAVALAAWRPGPITFAAAFVIIGTQQYALSILSHDGKHRNLFHSAAMNDFAALWLTSAPLGTDFLRERRIHLDHHSRLGDDDDPDRDLYRAGDKADFRSFFLYLTGLTTLPGVRRRPIERARQPLLSRVGALLWQRRHAIPAQILIFGVFTLALEWWLYFPLWIAPLFFMMLIPQRIRQFCEHAQPVLPDVAGDPHRLVTYRPPVLERIFLAPFHMGYHAEHHLWAAVPCFDLPRLAALLPESPFIERRSGYVSFLMHYFRRLPLQSSPAAV
jgi:fatty acid desaturase